VAVADLAALRAATDFDRVYTVTGEVIITALNSFRGQKFIEDESAAIYIYDEEGVITTSYNEGDGLTGVTGKLTLYFDMLELIPYSDPGATSSTGITPEPQVVALADFVANFEDYEAELIRIEGVTFTDADGTATFANGQNYTFTVGDDEAILRTHFWNTTVTGEVIPWMADVTGPALWDYSNPKIVPRYIEDLNIYSSVSALSDLMVDGATVDGFDGATLAYTVTLESGATAVPAVTATPAEENGSVTITPAANVTGTEAERTTTVEVVSHDKTSTTVYTIVFEVATSVDASLADRVNIYPVPVQFELTIENISAFKSIEIMDMAGSRVISTNTEGQPEYRIDVSPLPSGIYFLRLRTETEVITRKFIKK
ncbi:MAG: T9SS type A sorting domain-containing protein, partial [Bacteroidales bacterium]|nr:T9SS type A sorting domain-containing protein [Bacteroidales bacterium]